MLKKIEHILKGREKQITKEETVLQPLPHAEFRFANPFIVLHHQTPKTVQAGTAARIHPHPHRGFAPVTIMLQGEGFHQDNAGHSETVKAGEVQWMFAGKGLLHSEGPSENILKNGGVQELCNCGSMCRKIKNSLNHFTKQLKKTNNQQYTNRMVFI